MTVYGEAYASLFGGAGGISAGYESGFFGKEGRGLYAGVTEAGLHAEVSRLENGFSDAQKSWGFEMNLYYKMKNLGDDPETGKPRKYVGLSIPTLGVFSDILMYDHGNRNDNPIQKEVMGKDGKGINVEEFKKIADREGLDVGDYSAWASREHNPEKMLRCGWAGVAAYLISCMVGS